MKYINKYLVFEELDRKTKTSWRSKSLPGGIVEYTFYFNQRLFIVRFSKISRNIYIDYKFAHSVELTEREYGIRFPDGIIGYDELNLKYSKLLDLIDIVNNITIEFIVKYNIEILVIKHQNMDLEEVSPNSMNKRSRINYKFLKDKSSGYKISYYSHGNDHFSDATFCYIYKPDKQEDINELTKNSDFRKLI